MTHILHRTINQDYPCVDTGYGVFLRDTDGKEYIDASGGAAVSCLGHQHPDVVAAIVRQANKLTYAHTSFFTTAIAEELADRLVAGAPRDLSRAYLVSSGSEAMETALKMARQYFVELGQPQRRFFIGRKQSFHGNTLGALAVGGNEWRRKQFAPLLIETHHVSAPYDYRDRRPAESPVAYGARLAEELDAKLVEIGPQNVLAFVAETVGGATAGVLLPPPGYLERVRAVCDRHGILLILDEVMCGMGRTGTLHACEQEGISPDLMTLAKGLGGGNVPIGAVLIAGKIVETFRKGSGLFQHGHTYLGHPIACAAALAVQQVVERDRLLDNVKARGAQLGARLRERFGNSPQVGDIRGRGLFWALELVADRASKEPFAPAFGLHQRVKREAVARGLLVYPMGGTIDGSRGDHVLLAPPFIVDAATIDTIVDRLGDTIDACVGAALTANAQG
ncbi:MAG: aspartate aminotransferase family protein [Acidobacteria bacterium]|nr:aspartate aminotransferase family protein [Acidobacteriota bacterium]